MERLLEVDDLQVSFQVRGGEVKAVRGVSFHVDKGEAVGIVGESGCGKSVTAQSIMKLIPTPPAIMRSGSIRFKGEEIIHHNEKQMQKIRGKEMGMIFQDPMTSLNPTLTIGSQIMESLIKHKNMSAKDAKARAVEMLRLVGIPNPDKRLNQYPHEFSGGMRQRAMIAIALACDPSLLIADEPTTALDVTIQAQILRVMKDLQQQMGTSIIMITHDLGVVAELCDRVIVMYAGKVVEEGTIEEIFRNPKHPYTKGLLRSVPSLDQKKDEKLVPILGTPPDLIKPPAGCGFCDRCDMAMKVCKDHDPDFYEVSGTQKARCWLLDPMAQEVKQA
ncbi:ABC transporter ATP-binding protein [Marinicrinis lubricantis]|uniref:ABC transporter ATP-binding protein n=1 Tax=Marinicrinis lubricantis TaxID=2086470 RepID=A0ABW1IUM9_9BACL